MKGLFRAPPGVTYLYAADKPLRVFLSTFIFLSVIESATPCHDAQVVGLYWDSNPLRLTFLAAMSEDYTTAPQHLQNMILFTVKIKGPKTIVHRRHLMPQWQSERFVCFLTDSNPFPLFLDLRSMFLGTFHTKMAIYKGLMTFSMHRNLSPSQQ